MDREKADKERHVKGTAFVDLIKFLKNRRKIAPLPSMSPAAEALLDTRILVSSWYPLATFIDLLNATDQIYIKGSENTALEMGVAAGLNHLNGAHTAYTSSGDPQASVLSMRHAWRAHADFGDLSAEAVDPDTVVFTLKNYKDGKMVHSMMTAGWGIAAARFTGAKSSRAEIVERPWKGDPQFRYRICIKK